MDDKNEVRISLEHDDEVCNLKIYEANYENNGTKALIFVDIEDGEPFFELTTNIDGVENLLLYDDEICVKTWSENSSFIDQLLQADIFEDTGRKVSSGFVEASIWRYIPGNAPSSAIEPLFEEKGNEDESLQTKR
jgi:hypothetical protein